MTTAPSERPTPRAARASSARGAARRPDGEPAASDESERSSTLTIQSVERAASILGYFTPSRPRLTLTDITARLGVSKATAHRYTMALRKVNLLRYDRAAAAYTLGPQILTLAAAARSGLPMIHLAGPYMEELVREVNETVVLSVWDGEAPVVVRVEDGTERVVRISVRVGSRLELESAQGKVFSAFLPAGDVPGLPAELRQVPGLEKELEAVRKEGLAVGDPGRHGVRTLAVPVLNEGSVLAVLALIGTTATLSDDISSPAAKSLRRVASTLSAQFGRDDDGAAGA
jgi:DNA-binding IclR family transcriptional regulator